MVHVGDRVTFKGVKATVRFIGETEFSSGVWLGLELETQSGKNNGSVNGVEYFKCEPGYGVFVRESSADLLDENRRVSSSSTISDDRGGLTGNSSEERLKSIILKLETKLHALSQELSSMRVQYGDTVRENEELSAKLSRYDEDLESLTIDKETLEEQNELLKHEIQSMIEKVDVLQEEIKILKRINASDDSLTEKNIALEKSVCKLQQQITSIESSFGPELTELRAISSLYNQLKPSYEKLIEDHKKSQDLINELQNHIESSNQSGELVENLTTENIHLQEENNALLKQLKELEDLNEVESDLEKLHLENELELKEKIKDLELVIKEKEAIVKQLESNNQQLLAQEQGAFGTRADEPDQHAQHEIVRLENTRSELLLKLHLLEIEATSKEALTDELLGSFASKFFGRVIAANELQKFQRTYELLATEVHTTNNDSFIQLSSLKTSFNLHGLSLLLDLLHFKSKTASLSLSGTVKTINVLTDDLVLKIKDQAYLQIDTQEIEELLSENIKSLSTPFDNRENLKFLSRQMLSCSDLLIKLFDFLQDNVTIFEPCQAGINQTFKALKNMEHKVKSILQDLEKQTLDNNEISCDEDAQIISFTDDVKEWINNLLENINTIDTHEKIEVTQYLKKFENIANSFRVMVWKSVHVEEDPDVSEKLVGLENYEERIRELERLIALKDTNIEELQLKIGVYKSRLSDSKELSQKLKHYKESYDELSAQNRELTQQYNELQNDQKLSQEKIAKFEIRKFSILNNADFTSTFEQNYEKIELISKLEAYQNALKYYNDVISESTKANNDWLRQELPIFNPFQHDEYEELRRISRDLQGALKSSRLVTIG